MRSSVVAIRHDSDIGEIFRQKRLKPADIVRGGKRFLPVAVQTVDSDDAA